MEETGVERDSARTSSQVSSFASHLPMPSASFFALAALAAGAVAAPTSSLIDIKTVEGQTSGRYIVKFKDGASATTHLSNLRTTSSSTNITNQYRENFFNGFAGTLDDPPCAAFLWS